MGSADHQRFPEQRRRPEDPSISGILTYGAVCLLGALALVAVGIAATGTGPAGACPGGSCAGAGAEALQRPVVVARLAAWPPACRAAPAVVSVRRLPGGRPPLTHHVPRSALWHGLQRSTWTLPRSC